MRSLFVSDLHLEPEKPELTQFFLNFLSQKARNADALYILGDFFEVWVGDDEQLPLHEEIAEALSNLSQNGTQVFLMVGNRDFLMGDAFAQRCGARLISDPHRIELNGVPTLLMHGDSLCTDDTEYQKFRLVSRNPAWQQQVLSQPLAQRQKTARQLRELSQLRNQGKMEEIMDVNELAVCEVLAEHGAQRLIHGHTHRPKRHQHLIPDQCVAERIVLGDWHDHCYYVEADNESLQLNGLEASSLL